MTTISSVVLAQPQLADNKELRRLVENPSLIDADHWTYKLLTNTVQQITHVLIVHKRKRHAYCKRHGCSISDAGVLTIYT